MKMAALFVIAAILSGTSAFADFHVVFEGSGETKLLINGMPGNKDAVRFFNLMTAPFTVADNKQIKRAALWDAQGSQVLDITCTNSLKMKDFAHCELVFPVSSHAKPHQSQKFFEFTLENADVDTFLHEIALPATANPVFISGDAHLSIFVNRSEAGVSLDLQYQE